MVLRRRSGSKTKTRSGFESRIMQNLDSRKIAYSYETEHLQYIKLSCPSCGNTVTTCTYTPDFIFKRKPLLAIEGKGLFTSSDRAKMILVKRDNPKVDIRFIFQRNQFIRAGSKTRYGDWADKHGFPWCVGEIIPDEWLRV